MLWNVRNLKEQKEVSKVTITFPLIDLKSIIFINEFTFILKGFRPENICDMDENSFFI